MGGSEMILKVSAEQLNQWVENLEKRVASMEACFQNMKDTAANSLNYWQGDAGETHRDTFLEYQDDCDEVIARVREEANDLKQILRNYLGVMVETERMAQELPLDLIQ